MYSPEKIVWKLKFTAGGLTMTENRSLSAELRQLLPLRGLISTDAEVR